MRRIEMSTPSIMDAAKGTGMWPPLRTANRVLVLLRIDRAAATWLADSGSKTQEGGRTHVLDQESEIGGETVKDRFPWSALCGHLTVCNTLPSVRNHVRLAAEKKGSTHTVIGWGIGLFIGKECSVWELSLQR